MQKRSGLCSSIVLRYLVETFLQACSPNASFVNCLLLSLTQEDAHSHRTYSASELQGCLWQRTQHWITHPYSPALVSSSLLHTAPKLLQPPRAPSIVFHAPLHSPRMHDMLQHVVKVRRLKLPNT